MDFREADPSGALAAGRRKVQILEEDIGILDYDALATLTPTPRSGTTSRTDSSKSPSHCGTAATGPPPRPPWRRVVALHRRSADTDPARYQSALDQAIAEAAGFT